MKKIIGSVLFVAVVAGLIYGTAKLADQNSQPPSAAEVASELANYCVRREVDLEDYLRHRGYRPYRSTPDDYVYRNDQGKLIAISVDEEHGCCYVGTGDGNFRQFGLPTTSTITVDGAEYCGSYLAQLSCWGYPEARLDEAGEAEFYSTDNAGQLDVEIPFEAIVEIASIIQSQNRS